MPPQVERRVVSLDTLARATYNPRRIDKAERAGLAASLDRFGLVQEIVVNRRADGELKQQIGRIEGILEVKNGNGARSRR